VTRLQAPYLPVAAVQKTTDNYLSVSTDATARRIALKAEIAATTDALKAAKPGSPCNRAGFDFWVGALHRGGWPGYRNAYLWSLSAIKGAAEEIRF
jgi:hypothetical protein